MQEKSELAGLNDRLAGYIDKVRSLETENSRLTKQVQTQEEVVTREVTNIKALYEGELSDARKLLDETSKEKAKLKLENDKYTTENKDLKDRNKLLEKELSDLKKQKLAADAQVNDLQARLNDAVNQRRHWETEYNKVRKELDDLKKQYAMLQKQMEDETVQRVDLQNRIQSLKEELAFKNSVHERELNETRTRTRTEIEEVDGRIAEEYESRLREALQDMRDENDAKIEQARSETEAVFASKLAHLRDVANKNDSALESARNELKNSRRRIEELSTQVSSLSSQNSGYLQRIADLEGRLNREEEEHQAALSARDAEIRRLREALEDQLVEYRDLLDVKIQLDNEIQSYRRMLEAEETRLNISTADEATPSRSYRRTPVRGVPGSKKRKRGDTDFGSFLQQRASAAYSQKSHASGAVEVNETDTEGKFIKLFNTSDKEINLGGWQLKHTVGDQETIHKFHRQTKIEPQGYITVYSAGTDETHDLAAGVIVMKQTWFTGDKMTTELFNAQGEEQASRELSKEQMRESLIYRGSSSSDGSGLEGDPSQEKCMIM
jgi:lamin B